MVRNTYPHYLEDASRQRANMGLDLEVALSRLEEVCREKFEVRMEELIFPQKIWLINETNLLSRYMSWGEEDGVTMINLDEFESEVLANESTVHLFKTGKLVSFIRQFNLYDFKKKHDVLVDVDGTGHHLRFGLYYHSFVRPGQKDLLDKCERKVVKRLNHSGNGLAKRCDADSDSEDYVQPPKKRRLPVSPVVKIELADSAQSTESSEFEPTDEPPCPTPSRAARKMINTIPRELPVLAWKVPPPSPPPKNVIPKLTAMRLRSSPAAPPKEKVVLTKQQKDFQRVFWVKRWLEMPVEWRAFPDVGEKTYSDGWMEEFSWNLDPMVVGELAALANCGHSDSHVNLTDEELTQWMDDLHAVEMTDFPVPPVSAL